MHPWLDRTDAGGRVANETKKTNLANTCFFAGLTRKSKKKKVRVLAYSHPWLGRVDAEGRVYHWNGEKNEPMPVLSPGENKNRRKSYGFLYIAVAEKGEKKARTRARWDSKPQLRLQRIEHSYQLTHKKRTSICHPREANFFIFFITSPHLHTTARP